MTIEDIYRITFLTQDVEIYNLKSKDFVYIGECGNIPLSCMDIPVSRFFTNNNILNIIVE